MADARREHEFDVAVGLICFLGQSFAGKFRPLSANPYRRPAADGPKTPAQRKAESDEGWELLGIGLAAVGSQRGG